MLLKTLFNLFMGFLELFGIVQASFRSDVDPRLENIALRQQNHRYKETLEKSGRRIKSTPIDQLFWATLVHFWPKWRDVLQYVHADTAVRWHTKFFNKYWTRKSKPKSGKKKGRPPISQATIDLIRLIAKENPLWGSKHISQEIELKLGIVHSPRTVRKYMPKNNNPRPGSTWWIFLNQQAKGVVTCDFFRQHLANFQVVYVFVVMHLESRKIVALGVTEHPTLEFVKQNIREMSGWELHPNFLVHDNDAIYGQFHETRKTEKDSYRCSLDQWLGETMNIKGLPIPHGAPKAQAHIERCVKTLRVELLDHFIFWSAEHLRRVLGSTWKLITTP